MPTSKTHHITIELPVSKIGYGKIYELSSSDTISSTIELLQIDLDTAVFESVTATGTHQVTINQINTETTLVCDCNYDQQRLCSHQSNTLLDLIKDTNLLLFFNQQARLQKLRKVAFDYGLEESKDLDEHFVISYEQNRLNISPKNRSLTPVTQEHLSKLKDTISPETIDHFNQEEALFVVVSRHKYFNTFQLDLCSAKTTKQHKPKNPIATVDLQQHLWQANDLASMKFLIGLDRFKNRSTEELSQLDVEALRTIVKNPLNYPIYSTNKSDRLSATHLSPIEIRLLPTEVTLQVNKYRQTYEIHAQLILHGKTYSLDDLQIHYGCFLEIGTSWYLVEKLPVIQMIRTLSNQSGKMIIAESAFSEFRKQFLDNLENHMPITYTYIKKASAKQLAVSDYLEDMEKIIYLTDHGSHVILIPVMRYSDVEISVRSNRQVYGCDAKGQEFLVHRDIEAEAALISLLIKQHPDLYEQLENPLDHFYLHKRKFLDEDWFLPVFEEWGNHHIRIYGFNELEGNKINPNKGSVDIKVHSGLNWFNTSTVVKFGAKKASLKKVQVAVKNKSKYVELGDGTLGILPKEWLQRFEAFFTAGDLTDDDLLSIPKVNISEVEQLFEPQELENKVLQEIKEFHQKVNSISEMSPVNVPKTLNGTLRLYQIEGLKWLNFLDDFNFGGCLADDMGLGKSVQVISFILLLKQKLKNTATHLLVVPTTLVFNWQAEFRKFAPKLNIYTLHGADRIKDTKGLDKFDVVLTTYSTLLLDIHYLRKFAFEYVFLDESQQIKNPESQRYKAVKMLQARNRVAITGTPIENNTFDLYAQFSFACPGLFRTKQYFKELYSVPIDQFKDKRRAKELQDKIKPFLLRRTKEQVAQELPPKAETILYCPMAKEQQDTYLAYEKEFRDFISATEVEELKKNSMHVLRGLTKLRQICNSTKLLKSDEVLGQQTSSKLEVLKDQIEMNAPHHKMVIFSQFVSMLELIRADLTAMNVEHIMLTGKSSNREAIVNEFRNNDDVRVALISLKAGGTGLNLVEADYVYLVDPWWNPAVENQAIDRLHRIGQEKNITAIRLICPDTLEEKMLALQNTKRELSSTLISDNAKLLEKEELLTLLS